MTNPSIQDQVTAALTNAAKKHQPSFITYLEALGLLVVAGHSPEWRNNGIWCKGEPILFCYRDGTSWKVKREAVEDYIEGRI